MADASPPARTILHTGGAGSTSVAAATARSCAAAGQRTLLVSTGPVHGLGDLLGLALGPLPTAVGERLWALEVSARAEAERRAGDAWSWPAVSPVPPGLPELAAGLVLAGHAAGGWDVVVADCGPAGEALRLLVLPESARAWLAWSGRPRGRRAGAGAAAGERLPGAEALPAVDGAARALTAFADLLHDPELCTARLVVAPALAVAAARRTAALLALHGVAVDAVVSDAPTPPPVALREAFAPVAVLGTGAADPGAPQGLDVMARELWAGRRAAAVLHHAPVGQELELGRDGAALRLALPYADRADLTLQRVGGELVVGLGEHRRTLTLPPAIADYRPAGARFSEGALHVDFLPPAP